jgi:hypothetical protein
VVVHQGAASTGGATVDATRNTRLHSVHTASAAFGSSGRGAPGTLSHGGSRLRALRLFVPPSFLPFSVPNSRYCQFCPVSSVDAAGRTIPQVSVLASLV